MARRGGQRKREILAIGEPPEALQPGQLIAGYKPISDYGIIGNSCTGALVARDGSIDWCCLPLFDSPSTFAAILDTRKGGHFAISPAVPYRSSQRYIFDTNILVTTFETLDGSGEVEVVDFMPMPSHDIDEAHSEIHRLMCGVRGEMDINVVFRPRFDYGNLVPMLTHHRHGVVASNEEFALSLSTPLLKFDLHDKTAVATVRINSDAVFPIVMIYGEQEPKGITDYHSLDRLAETEQYWRTWVEACHYEGGWRDHVIRCGLAMKVLTYDKLGMMIGALTTSLPERIGGSENYDYRYIWIRHASTILEAVFNLGNPLDEATRFMVALAKLAGKAPGKLRAMYEIGGKEGIEERELPHLEGYKGSRPVRTGNVAAKQRPLDVVGEVLHCGRIYWQRTGKLPPGVWPSLRLLADFIVRHWRDSDYGIWEERQVPRQYTYSKAMCAAGLDAAIVLAENLKKPGDVRAWKKERELICSEVIEKGWNYRLQRFVKHFGSDELDPSALLFPMYGFVAADDPKMISTVDQITRHLSVNGLVYRCKEDGIPIGEGEGAHLLCSFWLAEYLIRAGRIRDAEQVFERLLDLGNYLSLYSEEVDAKTREFLGNFPHVLVHAALINLAAKL